MGLRLDTTYGCSIPDFLECRYTLRPKIFAPLDFYVLHLTIRLIQKICENVKTIMIYLKYI
jgi:hypothetical protein